MDPQTRIDTNNMDFSIDKEGCAEKSGYFGKQSLGVDVVGSLHSQEVSNDKEVLQRDQPVCHASNGETSKVNERSGLGFENEKFDSGEEEGEKKQEAFSPLQWTRRKQMTTRLHNDNNNIGPRFEKRSSSTLTSTNR